MQCIERAEGNPLFLEQLLRNAEESEQRQHSAHHPEPGAGADGPPGRARQARAAGGRGDRQALPAGGAATSSSTTPSYACDALVAADLVRPDSGDYLFAHALIQEGVYTSLLHSRKRELHASAGGLVRREGAGAARRASGSRSGPARAHARTWSPHRTRRTTSATTPRCGWRSAARCWRRTASFAMRSPCCAAIFCARWRVRTSPSLRSTRRCRRRRTTSSAAVPGWGLPRAAASPASSPRRWRRWIEPSPSRSAWSCGATCSRIHSTRGNLHFAQGNVSACGREHELALEYAQRAGDVECEALALSGLGDHCYAAGRMHTRAAPISSAASSCARKAGLMRVEIPNVGHGRTLPDLDRRRAHAGLREVRHAVELSNRVGLAQTEVMALESIGFALVFHGAYDEAQPWIEKAIAAARQAGRPPLPRDGLHAHGRVPARKQGASPRRARCWPRPSSWRSRSASGFSGRRCSRPWPASAEAPAERKRLLQEGEAMLESCLAHARLFFYRDAIDAALEDRELGRGAALRRGARRVRAARAAGFRRTGGRTRPRAGRAGTARARARDPRRAHQPARAGCAGRFPRTPPWNRCGPGVGVRKQRKAPVDPSSTPIAVPPPLRLKDAGEGRGGGKRLGRCFPPSQPSPASGGRSRTPSNRGRLLIRKLGHPPIWKLAQITGNCNRPDVHDNTSSAPRPHLACIPWPIQLLSQGGLAVARHEAARQGRR